MYREILQSSPLGLSSKKKRWRCGELRCSMLVLMATPPLFNCINFCYSMLRRGKRMWLGLMLLVTDLSFLFVMFEHRNCRQKNDTGIACSHTLKGVAELGGQWQKCLPGGLAISMLHWWRTSHFFHKGIKYF